MWKRILAYSLFGFGFLTITFFRRYSGEMIPYPSLFWLLGLVMFSAGLIFLRSTPNTQELNNQKQLKAIVEELKNDGEKIIVDLTSCEIKENKYTEEKDKYGHPNELLTLPIEREIALWNYLGGQSTHNIEQVEVFQSVIVFTYRNVKAGEEEIFISRVIPKDKISLMIYLERQKETILYLDKNNRRRYYFDLDFL